MRNGQHLAFADSQDCSHVPRKHVRHCRVVIASQLGCAHCNPGNEWRRVYQGRKVEIEYVGGTREREKGE